MMTYYFFAYGVLTIIGGLIGYFKAGSVPSLVSSAISGLLILGSTVLLLKGKMFGYYGLFGISALLAVFFAMRFFKSWSFMPAGLMLALSILSIVGLLVQKGRLLPNL